jgi:hypothetical protein
VQESQGTTITIPLSLADQEYLRQRGARREPTDNDSDHFQAYVCADGERVYVQTDSDRLYAVPVDDPSAHTVYAFLTLNNKQRDVGYGWDRGSGRAVAARPRGDALREGSVPDPIR